MPKLEYYHELDEVPESAEFIISPGRQLSIGCSLEDALSLPYGLSLMSQLNVIAGAMVADCIDNSTLVVTGNERAGYPQGAEALLDRRYPNTRRIVERDSPTTLASARHIAPIIRQLAKASGLVEIVITTDKTQGNRLTDLLLDQGVPIRGIAIARELVTQSTLPEDIALLEIYKANSSWKESAEAAKQAAMRFLDPHGTRVERIAKIVRP